jgi:hypothetical protein
MTLLTEIRTRSKRGLCSIDIYSKQGKTIKNGGETFLSNRGEHIDQNQSVKR